MNEMLKLVKIMHGKFGITNDHVQFTPEEKTFRHAAMMEEVNEYLEAETPEDELDALVDLIVFALGTVERQGFETIFDLAFERVMISNMQKIVGANDKRGSFKLDLKKPEGWVPADLSDLTQSLQETLFMKK